MARRKLDRREFFADALRESGLSRGRKAAHRRRVSGRGRRVVFGARSDSKLYSMRRAWLRRRNCRRRGRRRPVCAFADFDVGAELRSGVFAKQICGADREIAVSGANVVESADANDLAIRTRTNPDRVAPVQKLENRLQQVIAVGATADDVQKQIQLGRSGPLRPIAPIVIRWTRQAPFVDTRTATLAAATAECAFDAAAGGFHAASIDTASGIPTSQPSLLDRGRDSRVFAQP